MRLLSVADLHYTLKQFDWLQTVASDFDLILIPGDLLDIVSPVDIETQILVVKKYLNRIPPETTVLITSGNHDGDDRTASGESVAGWLRETDRTGCLVDGASFEMEDIRFTLCPWWDGEETRTQVDDLLAREAEQVSDRWAWLYHAPPSGSPLAWDGRREFGDEVLVKWIEKYQPDLVFGGHIHQAPFARDGAWRDRIGSTLLFNAGKQIGPVPAFLEIDTEANTVTWSSLAGVETETLFV